MRYILSTIALTALASSYVTALGINCRGSTLCLTFKAEGQSNVAKALSDIIQTIDDNLTFRSGDHIACIAGATNNNMCAFPQGVSADGLSAQEIKVLARRIVVHGCEGCGSVPVFGNNVKSQGQLTFNVVV